MSGPPLKGIAVHAEAEVTTQRDEEDILPMVTGLLQSCSDRSGLLLQPLHLQGTQPAVDGERVESRHHTVAWWKAVGMQQLFIASTHLLRDWKHQLGNSASVGTAYLGICLLYDVENHVVVCFVVLMAVA